MLFFITGGLYAWLVLSFFQVIQQGDDLILIPGSVLILSLVYMGKFCIIKFLGWISGTLEAADSYIFIVFLINKIVGILLIPVVILLAFSPVSWQLSIIYISLSISGLLFLSRYVRSYELLRRKIIIGRLHFLVYIMAIEVLPILILVKTFMKMLR
jgi:hypothetical protein